MCHMWAIAIIEKNKAIIVIFSIIIKHCHFNRSSVHVKFVKFTLICFRSYCTYACMRVCEAVRCVRYSVPLLCLHLSHRVSSAHVILYTPFMCVVCLRWSSTHSSEWASERSTNIQFNYTDSHAISSKAEAKTIVSCTQHNTCIHMCAELGRFKKWKHWFWYWTAFFDLCPYFGWNWEMTELFFTWDLAILCPERCQTWNPYLMFDRTSFQGRMELGRS